MLVRNYIQNNYSEIEKEFFNYIIDSFPESVLVQNGTESEEILAILAVLAKAFGSARETILNLDTAHGLIDLYEKINASNVSSYYLTAEDKLEILDRLEANNTEFNDLKKEAYLEEQNKKLLLPLALDLGYQVPDNININEAIQRLVDEKPLLEDKYRTVKNRGNRLALEQTLTNFVEYLKEVNAEYNIYESDIVQGSTAEYAISVLFNYLEDYIDTENTGVANIGPNWKWTSATETEYNESANQFDFSGLGGEHTDTNYLNATYNPNQDVQYQDAVSKYDTVYFKTEDFGDLINIAFVKQGTLLDQIIDEIRPAGIPYKILFKYSGLIMFNLLNNRVIRDLDNSSLGDAVTSITVDPLAIDTVTPANTIEFVEAFSGPNSYDVTIKNNSNIVSYQFNVADWSENTPLQSADYASEIWRWVVGGSTYTDGNYVFKNIAELNAALPTSQLTRNAVVTGYYWEETTESVYNSSAKKYNLPLLSEQGNNVVTLNEIVLPEFSLWEQFRESVAAKLQTDPFNVKYFRLRKDDEDFTKTFYQTAGTFGFNYSEYTLAPKQTRTVRRLKHFPVTTDWSDPFYLGIYASTLDNLETSANALVIQPTVGTPTPLVLDQPILGATTDPEGRVALFVTNTNPVSMPTSIAYVWSVGGGTYPTSGTRNIFVAPYGGQNNRLFATTLFGQQTITFTVTFNYDGKSSQETLVVNVNKIRN
jgi:hypothetical protein